MQGRHIKNMFNALLFVDKIGSRRLLTRPTVTGASSYDVSGFL